MNKINFFLPLSFFFFLWALKKKIYSIFRINQIKIELIPCGPSGISMVRENRNNYFSGASKTEIEFFKVIEDFSKKNKFPKKNQGHITYFACGFNALTFLYFKKNVKLNTRIFYYPHDLYYKNFNSAIYRKMHKYIHDKVMLFLCDVIFHCNKIEVNELKNTFPTKKILYIPPRFFRVSLYNKVINNRPIRKNNKNLDLIFIGSAVHAPNLIFMRAFIKSIFPSILKLYPNLTLKVIGLEFADLRFNKNDKVNLSKIKFYGIVHEKIMNKLLLNSNIGISPIQINSGVNMKILDYLFSGIPVISHISVIATLPRFKTINKFIFTPISIEQWISSINQASLIFEKSANQLLIRSYLKKYFDFNSYTTVLINELIKG